MRYVHFLGPLVSFVVLAPSADAAQTRTTLGVSTTVVYNCAMDMSKLTPAQRKVVEVYCGKQSGAGQQGSTGSSTAPPVK
jgi:hypothetical protein